MKCMLIKVNDSCRPDNINGRIQAIPCNTYEEAYEQMKEEVLSHVDKKYVEAVISGIEFADMYLDEVGARIHKDFGKLNYYWKIVKITG